ncbi:MAG: helix-turn-helix domain-containing protein [Chitinophagaceae bacterium]|nr:helix-turn-helix domain-containing protein [Chitinophagaceae bacterium]
MSVPKKSTHMKAPSAPADEQSLSTEWMLNEDAMKMLQCSLGTLKNLRSKKQLPFSKVGGIIYFNSADIQQMLLRARRRSLPSLVLMMSWLPELVIC